MNVLAKKSYLAEGEIEFEVNIEYFLIMWDELENILANEGGIINYTMEQVLLTLKQTTTSQRNVIILNQSWIVTIPKMF